MTKEQYKQRRDELEAQIKELEQQYIDACPYKVGDKVLVKDGKKEKKAFISHVGVNAYQSCEYYELDFCQCKKDGTKSLQSANLFLVRLSDIIRKID